MGLAPFYGVKNEVQKVEYIRAAKYKLPSYVSSEAASLLKQLLCVNPAKRIGCTKEGIAAIKANGWFRGIDWVALAKHQHPVGALQDCICFQNIPMDWKSDPLDWAGAECDPRKALQGFRFWGSVTLPLRTRFA